jgi:Mlc titration factor MtfA (ptsG expression regulator)
VDKFISSFALLNCYFCASTKHKHLDFLYHIGLIILVLAVIFTPMFGLYYLVQLFWNTFIENKGKYYHPNIDSKAIEVILEQKFRFYQNLPYSEKARFIKRTKEFIRIKEFYPSGGLMLTDEMVVLISASGIQLTFGLREYLLINFAKIFVYPKEYYSKYDKLYHKGEANLNGAIAFSWYHFVEGYDKPNDNLNLGLHEMAHALRFDKFKNDSYDQFFSNYFEKWHMISKDEFLRLKNHKPSFFREYGGTNINEFFSVCVEYFFESPAEFLKAQPEIYNHLSILLNQNPLTNNVIKSISESFVDLIKPDIKLEEPIIYQSGAPVKNILALLVVAGIWVMILTNAFQEGNHEASAFFAVVLPILGYFVFNVGFKKIYFYSNGIEIKYLLPNPFKTDNTYSYSEIIFIEFMDNDYGDYTTCIEIRLINMHKIKTYTFYAYCGQQQIKQLADILVQKKVAVKLNSFEY